MSNKIEPESKTIERYLKIERTERFVIPEYQRKYTWFVDDCDKLWQNIEEYIEIIQGNNQDARDAYFFGTVIVDGSKVGEIRLIDGQQRTVTFILLLKAILIRVMDALDGLVGLKNDEDTEAIIEALKDRRNAILNILYRIEAEERNEFLKNWSSKEKKVLLETYSINELEDDKYELGKILASKSYEEIKEVCCKVAGKKKTKAQLSCYFRNFEYFYQKLGKYNSEIRINSFAKVFLAQCQVIEIRSANFEQAISMFNSLNSTGQPLSDADIISAQLFSNAKTDRDAFQDKWEELKGIANELEKRKLIGLDSVLQQYMYICRAISKEYMGEEGSKADVTTPGLRKYYMRDNRALLDDPIELCKDFLKIAKIWDAIKDYPEVQLLIRFNENIKIYLVSYLWRFEVSAIERTDVDRIVECLVRLFAVLELVDTGYSSSKFKTFLFGANVALVDASKELNVITKSFSVHIKENWTRELLLPAVLQYRGNALVFLNEYLFHRKHSTPATLFYLSDRVNVEHVMPASGRNKSAIMTDAEISNKDDFEAHLNCLGNKIPLEENINKALGDDWFRVKKQSSIYEKKGYKNSKYSIASSLATYQKDKWTKVDIEMATQRAANRILDFIFED